jgi:hypothetical protein
MKKAYAAVIAGAMVVSGGVAGAQSPTTTPAAVTAEAAITAATTAIEHDGRSGLVSAGMLNFSFTPAGLTCPAGTTNPLYCADNVSGGFRFIVRVTDIRPGKGSRSVVIAALLIRISAGKLVTIDCVGSDPCLSIRAVGTAILRYGTAHHRAVPVQLIAHERPSTTTTSTEVIQFLNL